MWEGINLKLHVELAGLGGWMDAVIIQSLGTRCEADQQDFHSV